MKLLLATTIAPLMFFSGAAQADTNLVTNGSFEAPGPNFNVMGSFCYLGYPNMECGVLPGWSRLRGDVPVILSNSTAWQVPNSPFGNVLAGLQGFDSHLQQALSLSAGQTYTLTWSDAGRNYGVSSKYDVTFGGQTLTTVALGVGQGWTARSATFVAEGPDTLSFNGLTTGGDGTAFIDNVSLTAAVPEPASVVLLVAGLMGLAGFARRHR